MKMKLFLKSTAIATSILCVSCGDKKEDAAAAAADVSNSAFASDLGAKATVEAVKNDLAEGKITTVWHAMPSTYQSDLTSLVQKAGNKVDKELYNEVMTSLGAVSGILKDKKGIILELMEGNVPESDKGKFTQVTENWDDIVGSLDGILNSEIKTVEGLQKLDIASFMAGREGDAQKIVAMINKLAPEGERPDKLKSMSVEVVSEEGETATLKLDGNEGKMVKVGNRWVPSDMAEEWTGMITEANEGLDAMEQLPAAQKQIAIGILKTVQGIAEALEKTTNKEEFMNTLMKEAGPLQGMLGGMF